MKQVAVVKTVAPLLLRSSVDYMLFHHVDV